MPNTPSQSESVRDLVDPVSESNNTRLEEEEIRQMIATAIADALNDLKSGIVHLRAQCVSPQLFPKPSDDLVHAYQNNLLYDDDVATINTIRLAIPSWDEAFKLKSK